MSEHSEEIPINIEDLNARLETEIALLEGHKQSHPYAEVIVRCLDESGNPKVGTSKIGIELDILRGFQGITSTDDPRFNQAINYFIELGEDEPGHQEGPDFV